MARINLSGERFAVTYRLEAADLSQAHLLARKICVEQTIEFPDDLVSDPEILEGIIGKVDLLEPVAPELTYHDGTAAAGISGFKARITYCVESAGQELTQLLNVIFGNVSLVRGVRVEHLDLPPSLTGLFKGPRFGRQGLRKLLNVPKRPLVCTALKPMGLSPADLARQAASFAAGGIDLIKDDHGLTDQSFATFSERVKRCGEAVVEANARTSNHALYLPNVTAPFSRIAQRATTAVQAGAGGLLVCPGIVGFDAMRELAQDDDLSLPVVAHPAWQGTFVLSPSEGVSHRVIFGQLNRLAGADAAIFPSFGGRFSFSRAECADLLQGTQEPMGHLLSIFPAPAGGMTLERVPELLSFYGDDVVILVGGDLHRHGPDLVENCKRFRELLE